MEPLTMIATGGQILSTIGGLLGNKKERGLDLGKLRSEAVANGFNPLTVLRMTGGAGFVSDAQPSPLGLLGEGVSSVASILSVAKDRDIQTRESEARIAQMGAQTAAIKKTAAGVVRTAARPLTVQQPKTLSDGILPSKYAGVDIADIPFGEVRALNGQVYKIRKDVMEAQNIGEGQTMLVKDIEDIGGEIAGALESVGSMVAETVGVGDDWMLTTPEVEAIEKKKAAVFQPFTPLTVKPVMRQKAQPGWMDQKLGPMQ